MQPESSDRLQGTLAAIRAFVREEVQPLEAQFLTQPYRTILPALNDLRARVKELNLWAPHLPEIYGGMGFSLPEFARVSEELGRSPLGHYVFNCQAPDVGNMELLLEYGSEAQQQRYLEPLVRGDIRSCFSMTEPELPGSNPTLLNTTAVKDGDDYVINGHKWFTTAADGAAFAIVMAVTNPEAESRHKRASMIIVPTDTPGFNLVRNIPVMGHAGEEHHSHAEIRYEDCRAPQANLLGPEGAGFALAQARLGPGRIHHCMRWIGICERAFDLMCSHAARREIASGRSLGSFGNVMDWIAESRAEINAARLMVLATADKIERAGQYAARDDISLIKFHVASVLQRVLDRGIQVHGGLGVTDYTPLAFWYREERAARIYDGPDEVHKMSVARRILKKYTNQ
ncbi:MAG: acyl-CoA dehydrogenase family protein [Anaerolineales bacterium]